MTNYTNDDGEGRGSLREHVSRIQPPPDLEHRVRGTLELRGVVGQSAAWRSNGEPPAPGRHRTWALLVGLLAAGFLLGLFAWGALGTGRPPTGAAAPGQYVLLLYGDPVADTGAVHAAREREYGQWASSLTGGARWVGGHELHEVVESLGPSSPASASSDARLAGYFVIEAPSRERAAEVARSCPHLRYGGRVVVMTIAG